MARKRNLQSVRRRNKQRKKLKKLKLGPTISTPSDNLTNTQTLPDELSVQCNESVSSHPDLPPFVDVHCMESDQHVNKGSCTKEDKTGNAFLRTKIHTALTKTKRDPLVLGLELLNEINAQRHLLMSDASVMCDVGYAMKKW